MNSLRLSSAMIAKRAFSSIPAGSYLPSNEVAERILKVVRKIKGCPEHVSPASYFVTDLNFDSAQRKEVNRKIAEEFCIRIDAATREQFNSIDTAVKFVASHPKAR